ncbi:MAG: hypothetical protein MO846_10350 [Candidatus Devosia symbiotica]|nr:hypothetical protein [Candidatus Devosia symbiotica]
MFESTRRMQYSAQQQGPRQVARQIAHMQKFVDRFRALATKAKKTQARIEDDRETQAACGDV